MATDDTIAALLKTGKTRAAEALRPAHGLPLTSKLSARLLWLTVAFVMLAEIGVFAPSMARFRLDYLNAKLAAAHLVLTALEASPEQVDPVLRDRLLDQAGMLGMTAMRPNMPARTLGPHMPSHIPEVYDLRSDMVSDLLLDAFITLIGPADEAMAVTGVSPADPAVVVEVVLDEAPLRNAMWVYARRILFISVFLSLATAVMVYFSLQWLAVRPLRRLTLSMIGFRDAPEDPHRVITPSGRNDEVGVAEQALSEMQQELREALLQKERLAGVGTAVTKISHDLRNILATAMLESDRLESVNDPEVRRITAGIVRAIDRAVALSASTLRFAREGLPHVKAKRLNSRAFLEELRESLQPALPAAEIALGDVADFSFEGDPELLHRAFENLLRNAAEAGATQVTLSARREDRYGVACISDNGRGLSPKALNNLFVPFAGSARSDGSGLGLPIARELLRVQGGDVVLEHTSPQGACFAVRLPV
jgi:signal transduction histidine kinase